MNTDELKALIQGINSRNGTINCARVALRLDEHLAVGKNLGLPSVSTLSGGLFTYPTYIPATPASKAMLIKRSKTDNPILISRCSLPKNAACSTGERIDLTHED